MNSSKGGTPSRGRGRVRIIAGEYRRRLIGVAPRPELRPTPDRVRETLFNWLGQDLHGLQCLDLYAGSGALGFEAASRGAARVVMVEKDRGALAQLERNRAILGAAQVEIVAGDALRYLEHTAGRFDVVFLDPPFRQNAWPDLAARLPPCLAPGARVYVEGPQPVVVAAPWRELRNGRAGEVSYQLLNWDGHDPSRVSGNV
ncbi:MAG: 16S rRNA (guanine(966)-N(2))-methyltransferase RsmD [Betaproteobacteria bacterium RIFCSPLOWO2_02_FULL_67_19]|nr:MAG: 16S rRNA (guanine(966)-N(2))-methyltransferase RsmD [Betaproteobacteria bacterium RIFCSPLOWO2_02_FULL_67_19]